MKQHLHIETLAIAVVAEILHVRLAYSRFPHSDHARR